ncbi:MAG: hypothetical protein DDT31_01664 [Syntrophomonadaceae bacterium]|nr:hypothetical protein [Bacillota bacterium]
MNSVLDKLRARVKEKIEKKASKQRGYGLYNIPDGVEFFKPQKAGTYHLDILPYKVSVQNHPQVSGGEVWFERTVFVHFSVGDEQLAYICPKTIAAKCPICEERAKMFKDPNADEELIKQLRPKERQLFNVIDLDDKEPTIKIWEVSNFLFGGILEEEIRNGDEENASFFFYEGGKTLKVRFKQESFGDNSFLKTHRIDFEDREDYGVDVLKKTIDLDKLLIVLPYEELGRKFLGLADDESPAEENEKAEENEVEENEKAEKVPVKRRRTVPVREEDDDDELDFSPKSTAKQTKHDDDEELPMQEASSSGKEKGAKANGGCPAGGKFGEDCNNLKECDICGTWSTCQDKRDELDAQKRKKKIR